MLGIAIMFLILFRSFKLAVIGILPNLLGAGVVLGAMGLAKIPLDMMTITIAAITIGIGVDNGIHYIYRFREEFAQNNSYVQTLHICHASIGKAVFYTTLTVIIGFSILVFSNFIPTIYFGLLTAAAMFIALISALTVLPRLILMWRSFGAEDGSEMAVAQAPVGVLPPSTNIVEAEKTIDQATATVADSASKNAEPDKAEDPIPDSVPDTAPNEVATEAPAVDVPDTPPNEAEPEKPAEPKSDDVADISPVKSDTDDLAEENPDGDTKPSPDSGPTKAAI
jgi:uncharacterized membrane protein YdfJ with MMPL/SSD domain